MREYAEFKEFRREIFVSGAVQFVVEWTRKYAWLTAVSRDALLDKPVVIGPMLLPPETLFELAGSLAKIAKAVASHRNRSRSMMGEKNPQFGRTGEKSTSFGRKASSETRKKIGESRRQYAALHPHRHTAEAKRKMSERSKAWHASHTFSPEARRKMSESGRRSFPHTPESKRKMSEIRKAWHASRKASLNGEMRAVA